MKSRRDWLVVSFLILVGSLVVDATQFTFRQNEDCDNFEERGASYNLPDDIMPWEKIIELEPCCKDEITIPGCTICTDSKIWEFKRADDVHMACTVVPGDVIAAVEALQSARKRTAEMERSRVRNIDSAGTGLIPDTGGVL